MNFTPSITRVLSGRASAGYAAKLGTADGQVMQCETTDDDSDVIGVFLEGGQDGQSIAVAPLIPGVSLDVAVDGATSRGDALGLSEDVAGAFSPGMGSLFLCEIGGDEFVNALAGIGGVPPGSEVSLQAAYDGGHAATIDASHPFAVRANNAKVALSISPASLADTVPTTDACEVGIFAPVRLGKNLGVSEKLYFAAGADGYDVQMKHTDAGADTTTICDWWFMACNTWAPGGSGGDFIFFTGLGVNEESDGGVWESLGSELEGAFRVRLGQDGDDLNAGIEALDLEAVGGYRARFGLPVLIKGQSAVGGNLTTGLTINNTQAALITLGGSTSNRISFSAIGLGAPTFSTQSAGVKLSLYDALDADDVGFGVGVESGYGWLSVSNVSNTQGWKFYAGTTEYARVSNVTGDGGRVDLYGDKEEIRFNAADNNPSHAWIRWFPAPVNQTGVPNKTTRSPGTRLIFYPLVDTVNSDYGIGLSVDGLGHVAQWYSAGVPHGLHLFYSCDALAAVISDNLLGFYGTAGVAQPTAAAGTTGFTAHASANAVYNESTWTGNTGSSAYTMTDIVKALKDTGLIAA